MWNLFKSHEDISISALAVLFVTILGVIFFRMASTVLVDLNKAIMPSDASATNATFDLDGARLLHLKGQAVSQE